MKPEIEEKIRKLLRLAQNNPSPEEAAVAFAHAQRLATLHALDLDDLDSEEEPEPVREVEKITAEYIDRWDRAVPWKLSIAGVVLRANGCRHSYQSGFRGGITGYGQPSDLATSRYLYHAIVKEVDTLAREAVKRYKADPEPDGWETPKAYGRAFRIGCAHEISRRMRSRMEEVNRARGDVDFARTRALANGESLAGPTHALVKVERAAVYVEAVEKAISEFFGEVKFRRGRAMGGVSSSSSGYQAGRRAGASVNLGGKSKAIGGAS